MNLDVFSCTHKICPVCLFRRIFILNITELNGSSDTLKIKCNKCPEGTLTKNLDELIRLSTKKSDIFKEKNENMSSANNDESIKRKFMLRLL